MQTSKFTPLWNLILLFTQSSFIPPTQGSIWTTLRSPDSNIQNVLRKFCLIYKRMNQMCTIKNQLLSAEFIKPCLILLLFNSFHYILSL